MDHSTVSRNPTLENMITRNASKKSSVTVSFAASKLTEHGGSTAGSHEFNLASNARVQTLDDESSSSGTFTEESTESSNTSINSEKLIKQKIFRKFTGKDYSLTDSDFSVQSKTKGQVFCDWFSQRMARMFSFPFLSGERICFHQDDLEPDDEEASKAAWKARKTVEELVNFETLDIKNMYANILEERKQVQASKDKYHFAKVDLTPYPQWDNNIINRHRATFQIFDISGDGVIDFEEFSNVLSEFGDKTTPEIRLKHFSKAKTDEFGTIGFEDFLMIVYELTEKEVDSSADQSLVDTFKKIDNNMSIRCRLDVLGQLQGGLF